MVALLLDLAYSLQSLWLLKVTLDHKLFSALMEWLMLEWGQFKVELQAMLKNFIKGLVGLPKRMVSQSPLLQWKVRKVI